LNTEKIVGVIYPIPSKLIDRFFDGDTKTFVKCLSHDTTRVAPKNKIIFYASHGSKELTGEGTIKKVEFLDPETILSRYKQTLFLTENEFRTYIGCRTRILVLTLSDIKKYSKPIKYKRSITMAGQYVTKNEYFSLLQHSE
jgi:hypothetical protein